MSHKIPKTGLKSTSKKKKRRSLTRGWKILFKYLLEYKKELISLSVLGIISALANGFVPYIIGRFFDAILTPSIVFINTAIEMPLWLSLLILFGAIQIIANIVDWINSRESSRIGITTFASYKARAAGHLLKLPLSFHSNRKTGEVMEKIQRAANSMAVISNQVVISLAPQFLSIFIGFAIAFYINLIQLTIPNTLPLVKTRKTP